MQEFIKEIVAGIAALVISVFLPKHIQTLIREFLKYIFRSLIRYWHSTVISILLPILFITFYKPVNLSLLFILLYSITVIAIITTVALYRELRKKYDPLNIAVYGCYTVKGSEYLTIDVDSELLNEYIKRTLKGLSEQMFSIKVGFIKTHFVELPKFLPILLGGRGLHRLLTKRANPKQHTTLLYFIRNVSEQKLATFFYSTEENMVHDEGLDKLRALLDNVSSDSEANYNKIISINIKLYFLVYSQMIYDVLIQNELYKELHYCLDDSFKLIDTVIPEIADISQKNRNKVEGFLQTWVSNFERYKAIAFIEQGEYLAAIDRIFKAIRINPYFPYDNYVELKQDYAKKHGIALSGSMAQTLSVLQNEENSREVNQIKNAALELSNNIQYKYASFHYDIVHEIMRRDSSEAVILKIEQELNRLNENDPFSLLIKSEVLKYLKKGEEKINEVYAERFDECVNLLRRIVELDPEFTFIRSKIGGMLLAKSMFTNDESLIQEAFEEYANGMHYLSEIGMVDGRIHNDNKGESTEVEK